MMRWVECIGVLQTALEREYVLRKIGGPTGPSVTRMSVREALATSQLTPKEASKLMRDGLPSPLNSKLVLISPHA